MSVVLTLAIFAVNFQFTSQKVQQSLRTKIELCEMKYDHILTEVLGINRNIENLWENLNDTRNMQNVNSIDETITPDLISKEHVVQEKDVWTQSAEKGLRALVRRQNIMERAFRNEKHASRTLLEDIQTKYKGILDAVNTIRTDQVNVHDELSKLANSFTDIQHDLTAMHKRIDRENDEMKKETVKLQELIAKTKSETDGLIIIVNNVKDNYHELQDDYESPRKVTSVLLLKQKGWVQHDNSLYKGFDDKLSWMDAMEKCKLESFVSGYLAEVQNINEAKFATGLVSTNRYYFWLGGRENGFWKWCGSGKNITFVNWLKFYPESGDNSNCLVNYSNYYGESIAGKWHHHPCTSEEAYVCEVPLVL